MSHLSAYIKKSDTPDSLCVLTDKSQYKSVWNLHLQQFYVYDLISTERTKIIFSATAGRGNAHIGPFNTDIIIDYKKVITNLGNAYSPVTGKIYSLLYAHLFYFTK